MKVLIFTLLCALSYAQTVYHKNQAVTGTSTSVCIEISLPDTCSNQATALSATFDQGSCSDTTTCTGDVSTVTASIQTVLDTCDGATSNVYCPTTSSGGSDDTPGSDTGNDGNQVACSDSSSCGTCGFCNMDNVSDGFCETCDEGVMGCTDMSTAQGILECSTVCAVGECAAAGPDCGADAATCIDSCPDDSMPTTCEALQELVNGCASGCSQCFIDYYNDLLTCEGDDAVNVDSDSSAAIYSFFAISVVAVMSHF